MPTKRQFPKRELSDEELKAGQALIQEFIDDAFEMAEIHDPSLVLQCMMAAYWSCVVEMSVASTAINNHGVAVEVCEHFSSMAYDSITQRLLICNGPTGQAGNA